MNDRSSNNKPTSNPTSNPTSTNGTQHVASASEDMERNLEEEIQHLKQQLATKTAALNRLRAQNETKSEGPPFPSKRPSMEVLSRRLIVQYPPVQPGVDRTPYHMIAWWKDIFSYIQPNDYERLQLRRQCHMFKASLKPPPPQVCLPCIHI